jgi:hypothetical protein
VYIDENGLKIQGREQLRLLNGGSRLSGKIARRSPIFAFVAFLRMTRFGIGVAF